jgi:hypothetical protein
LSWRCRAQTRFSGPPYFAQTRVVFAVALTRCNELFNPPGYMTVWNLPAEIEDQFEEYWQDWLDQGEQWTSLSEHMALLTGNDRLRTLSAFDLISQAQLETVSKLHRSAENCAVPQPRTNMAKTDSVG